MIANLTPSAYGVMTGASRAAASPLHRRVRAVGAPLHAWAAVCPQAPVADLRRGLVGGLIAGVRIDGPAERSVLVEATQSFGPNKEYGTTPQQSGTTVWKLPV